MSDPPPIPFDLFQMNQEPNQKLKAFLLFTKKGFEQACAIYPEEVDFILDNRNKTFEQVREELLNHS